MLKGKVLIGLSENNINVLCFLVKQERGFYQIRADVTHS
jgi:hypothetical protein